MNTKPVAGMMESPHPAAVWAAETTLDPLQVDCVTVEMLKILDHKCEMPLEEQIALMAVYSVIKERDSLLFDNSIHTAIAQAMQCGDIASSEQIHNLRLHAEQEVPQVVMKHFKRYLRESLYGV
jgi:hypothetical protein